VAGVSTEQKKDYPFVGKYDAKGKLLWKRTLTDKEGNINSIGVDAAGGVYISGYLETGREGIRAAFLARFVGDGTLVWKQQMTSERMSYSSKVVADQHGNIYITGVAYGAFPDSKALGRGRAFVAKYNNAGVLQWVKRFGSKNLDTANSLSVDREGNIYVAGATQGIGDSNRDDADAFLAKFSPEGKTLWTKQLGTTFYDDACGVAVDAFNHVYITGVIGRPDIAVRPDPGHAFLAQFNSEGQLLWQKTLASKRDDRAHELVVDRAGKVYIVGLTEGDLAGANAGLQDAFIARYEPDGTLSWVKQLGTAGFDLSYGLAAGTHGDIYLAGISSGAETETAAEGSWVARFDQVPQKTMPDLNFAAELQRLAQAITGQVLPELGHTLGLGSARPVPQFVCKGDQFGCTVTYNCKGVFDCTQSFTCATFSEVLQ